VCLSRFAFVEFLVATMQFRRGALAALLGAASVGHLTPSASALVLSAAAAVESGAVAWLRAHRGAPQQDELAELRGVNPEAYALVKALLTKRSLGLLDPRHPTASFSAAPAVASVPGAEAFQKIGEESGDMPNAAAMYPDAPVASGHHDWLNWKPQASAADDESMVQNVLGAVAAVKQGSQVEVVSAAPVERATEAPLAAEVTPASAPVSKPTATMKQENSYLKDIDFGLGSQPSRSKKSPEENSYLKEFDLTGASSAPPAHKHPVGLSAVNKGTESKNYLMSFNWDDDKPAPKAQSESSNVAAKEEHLPKTSVSKPKAGKKDALLAWLDPAAANKVVVTTQAPSEQNSYLKDLGV